MSVVEGIRWKPTKCKDCGRRERKNLRISARGLCTRCALNRVGASHEQMRTGTGQYGEKWVNGLIKAAERARQRSQAS